MKLKSAQFFKKREIVAREYSTALAEGGDYRDLPRAVVISIINFRLFGCTEFHSEYRPLEVTRHDPLSDKMSLHFFELPKLPAGVLTASDELLLWLLLFKAETAEELEKIKALEVPVMNQAIQAYEKLTVSPEFRELERARSYARHNEASALRHAREQGHEDVARNALAKGIPLELIRDITGLDDEALKRISKN